MQRTLLKALLASAAVMHNALAQTADTPVNAGMVSASSTQEAGLEGGAPASMRILQSGDTIRVLDQAQMQPVGPVAGAAQALIMAPGANVTGYGNTGSSKYTISLNGLTNGWAGAGGYGGNALVQVDLDGVPMNNPSTGLYPSATLPQLSMIESTGITYGAGQAANRGFDSSGGTVNFIPIQPTAKPGGSIALSYGSFGQRNLDFSLRTGTRNGWSSVFAGGLGSGHSFRVGPDGFNNPGHNYALYGKTIRRFDGGSIALGAYYGKGDAYRPNVIPLTPSPAITINGFASNGQVIPGPLYSEKSGFYESLPASAWTKYDKEDWWDVYTRLDLKLTQTLSLHDLAWGSDEQRIHAKVYNFQQNSPQQDELLDPTNHTLGDKLWMSAALPFDTVKLGGYVIHGYYNTKADFWNPAAPYFGSQYQPNGAYRSGAFTQTNTALFLQDDIQPLPAWHITPGLRFVHYDVRYRNLALGTAPQFAGATGTDQSSFGAQHNAYGAIEPSVSTNYRLRPGMALYGSLAETYATPLVGGGGGLYQAVPASGTHLEVVRQGQIGFKADLNDPAWFMRHLSLGANYFDLRVSRQVITATLFGGAEEIGLGTSRYRGVDVYADADPVEPVHIFLNGSLERARYSSYQSGGLDFSGRPVPYVPMATLNYGIAYQKLLGAITITPKFWLQFMGRQTYFDDAAAVNASGPVGAPSSAHSPAYQTLNLSLDAKLPLTLNEHPRIADLSLSVLNLRNTRYNFFEYGSAGAYFNNGTPIPLGYPGAPLTVYGQVALEF